jgi:hypothetical protein
MLSTVKPTPSPTATRLSPRLDWELNVAWRALEMVEKARGEGRSGEGVLKDHDTPGRPPGHNAEFARISPDLKNFLLDGSSSLTPYEATLLGLGLGISGTLRIEGSEKRLPYHRGDRVTFQVPGESHERSGIVTQGGILSVNGNDDYQWFTKSMDKVTNITVIAEAHNDGKLEQLYGN